MKLAQRQASLDLCPDVSEEAKQKLSEASAPPVKPIMLGSGDLAVKMGEETVLFRHDKRFVNPCVFALEIKDTLSDDEISNKVEAVCNSEIDRIGQKLRIDAIAITNDSNDAKRFESVAKGIVAKAPGIPTVLCATNPQSAESALKFFADKNPVIYGCDQTNIETMTNIAKTYKATLGLKAQGLEELTDMTEKVKALGVENIVIDSGARTAKDILEHNTLIRRAAIKKNFKPLGYPIITFAQRDDNMLEAIIAGLGVAKYSSIIVLKSIEEWKNLALFTLRQNIYTDPQVPMQVEQKIYKIGEPTSDSPLFITTNFSLTYFIVSGEVENSKVPSYLAVMDCEGLSVLTAWAAGKFTAAKIAEFIKESGVENEINHREIIIPGYVAILSGAIEDKLEGWKITVGPREANGIPAFMKSRTAH